SGELPTWVMMNPSSMLTGVESTCLTTAINCFDELTRKIWQRKFLLLKKRDATADKDCTANEDRDSYKAPKDGAATGSASDEKKGRAVVVTTEDMQKRRNDVKARMTLLLALLDEHQLRFSKYKTAQELWAAISKTFGGNEATRKTKKNQLKHQYGNFKAEGKETLEQTFNRLELMDVEIEQDVLNQKFLTSLAPEWLMYTIVWRNKGDLDTTSLDDLYNHLKVYEPEVQKKSESNSHNMDFISSAKNSSGNGEVNTTSAPKDLMAIDGVGWDWSYMANEEENHALVADEDAPIEFALMAKSSTDNEELETLKKEKEGLDSKLTGFKSATKDLDNLIESQRSDKIKEGLGYSAVPPPAQVYSLPKRIYLGPPKFVDDTITDYIRPSPSVESNPNGLQNNSSSVFEIGESTGSIISKPEIKFVKPADSPTVAKTNKDETARKPTVKYAKMYNKLQKGLMLGGNSQININDKGYWDSGWSWHMTGNISYLSDYEPYDGGYVSFGQGGCKITGKGTIKNECIVLGRNFKLTDDTNVLLRTPRQHNMYSINLNNVVPHKDLTCLVAKASADECMLWHRRLGHLNFKIMNRKAA
nr:ribonuclease H-like domain-containing protein [Tanacetum cinerariifolium]